MITRQLPLNFRLRDEATLERFVVGENQELLALLQDKNNLSRPIYLYGSAGVGKTHLLQGLVRQYAHGLYLPFAVVSPLQPVIMEGMMSFELICLDDIDVLAGQDEMELALFGLINQLHEQNKPFVLSATQRPDQGQYGLKDLVSRLNACAHYQLHEPDDEQKCRFLKQDAKRRGMILSDGVIDWLITRLPRDMASLVDLMNQLDVLTLAEKRQITIPFLRSVLLMKRSGGVSK